jgi:hypothetical protein
VAVERQANQALPESVCWAYDPPRRRRGPSNTLAHCVQDARAPRRQYLDIP